SGSTWAETPRRLGEPQRFGQPVPSSRIERPVLPQRVERGHDLGAIPVDSPIAQFPDHTGKPVLVLVLCVASALAAFAELPELFRQARGGNRLELLLVGHRNLRAWESAPRIQSGAPVGEWKTLRPRMSSPGARARGPSTSLKGLLANQPHSE